MEERCIKCNGHQHKVERTVPPERMVTRQIHPSPKIKMNQYETDKERANLREQILMAREHSNRTTGEMREANLSHMNAAIVALRELNQKSK